MVLNIYDFDFILSVSVVVVHGMDLSHPIIVLKLTRISVDLEDYVGLVVINLNWLAS